MRWTDLRRGMLVRGVTTHATIVNANGNYEWTFLSGLGQLLVLSETESGRSRYLNIIVMNDSMECFIVQTIRGDGDEWILIA